MKPVKQALLATAALISLLSLFPVNSHAAQNAANFTGDITLKKDANLNNAGIHFSNGTYQNSASPWSFSEFDIYYTRGNVGIGGTPAVGNKLEVFGTVNATSFAGDGSTLSNIWKTGGNAGTTPSTHYIGTSDNQALEIKVNNFRAIRIDPTGSNGAPNIAAGHPSNIASGTDVLGATVAGGGSTGDCFDSAPSSISIYRSCANQATNYFTFVGGGVSNQASGTYSVVGGGVSNTASGQQSYVAGGYRNRASNAWSVVAGGAGNYADGYYSIVAGGANNHAGGNASFAAGWQAIAAHNGTFVWSDGQSFTDFQSTAPYQFLVRATGGVGINTNAPHEALTIGGNGSTIELGSDVAGKDISAGKIGYQKFTADALDIVGAGTTGSNRKIHFWTEGGASFTGPVYSTGQVQGNNTTEIAVYGINLSTDKPSVEGWNQGTGDIFRGWSGANGAQQLKFRVLNDGRAVFGGVVTANGVLLTSDLRLKTDIQPLENTLAKVLNLRGVSYVMKADETKERKIGVIAQELEQEYPELVATDDKGMKSVAYANLTAVLIEAVKGLKAENDVLRAELTEIRKIVGTNKP